MRIFMKHTGLVEGGAQDKVEKSKLKRSAGNAGQAKRDKSRPNLNLVQTWG